MIEYGGNPDDRGAAAKLALNLVLRYAGLRVVVHGGGPQISGLDRLTWRA